MTETRRNILLLAAEVVPFAKTGGLADVAGALPKALEALGQDIRVVMPRYSRIDPERFHLETIMTDLMVPLDDTIERATVRVGRIGKNIPVYLIDNDKYFNREGIYGYHDDGERFVFYCRAAMELVKRLGWQPDVLHCNDWHTAIVPNWMRTLYRQDPFFATAATVYTIHNLQYQGIYGWRILEVAGIDEYGFVHHPQIKDLDNVVDLMARGIMFADTISTVSERYAQEILTPEYGERLDPLLRDRRDRLFGIVNGIDYEEMNPATDRYIAAHFDADHLAARAENKASLQREANLPVDPDVPLIGMISRLADQKGFDILGQVMDHVMDNLDCQLVLLGTGDQHYHDMFSRLAQRYAKRLAVFLTFNAALAQKIYAGSDLFLMPSRFEPCGLGQLISMRYGSVPIVRSTGGLADTVQDFDPCTGAGNGFAFSSYDRWALFTSLVRAVENYRYRDTWLRLQTRGMTSDFSWDASARKYLALYDRAMAFRRQTA
ncbi:MAG: glycogen synthase GlgA [Chloroflexi bacterium]|nr:glycogen synthase GlgA [Chloroflexota bacterium]